MVSGIEGVGEGDHDPAQELCASGTSIHGLRTSDRHTEGWREKERNVQRCRRVQNRSKTLVERVWSCDHAANSYELGRRHDVDFPTAALKRA